MGAEVFTIYCHIHRESGRRYVGQTKKTMLRRWNQHVYTSTVLAKKGWSHFANAIRKYGKDAFDHEILETCATVEEANAAEEKWIAHFNTRDPLFGFNIMRGGLHVPHPVQSPWDRPGFRERASNAMRERMADPAVRQAVCAAMKVVCADPDWRKMVSERAKAQADRPGEREARSARWDKDRCAPQLARGAERERAKTHCPKGHEYSPENTVIQVSGDGRKGRVCVTCRRERSRGRPARKKLCACGASIKARSIQCHSCNSAAMRGANTKTDWHLTEELRSMVESSSLSAVGRSLGVSYQAVANRLARSV